MARSSRMPALSFDDYLKVLRQLNRSATHPRSALSVLLRLHGRGDEHRSHLVVAEQVVAALTAEQRRAEGRTGWPEREMLAATTGVPSGAIDRLVIEFDEVSEVAGRYNRSGPWRKLMLLAETDPILTWLRGRPRP